MKLFLQALPRVVIQFLENAFRADFVQQFNHRQYLFVGKIPITGNVPEFGPDNIEADIFQLFFILDHFPHFAAGMGKFNHVLVQQGIGKLAVLVGVGVDNLIVFLAVNNDLNLWFRFFLWNVRSGNRRRRRVALFVRKAGCQRYGFLEGLYGIIFFVDVLR